MNKFIIFILILGLLSSCGKDCTDDQNPECSNYSPCKYSKEVNANFGFLIDVDGKWTGMFDTFPDYGEIGVNGAYWIIDTTAKYDYYEWHIGSEVVANEPILFRRNFPVNETIEVMLVVQKKPNKSCFPKDGGRDTLIKYYKVMADLTTGMHPIPMLGRYEMTYIDHPTIKQTFQFDLVQMGNWSYKSDNFPEIQCISQLYGAGDGYNEAYLEGSTCLINGVDEYCKIRQLWLRRKAKGSNEFEMKVRYIDNRIIYGTGRKI